LPYREKYSLTQRVNVNLLPDDKLKFNLPSIDGEIADKTGVSRSRITEIVGKFKNEKIDKLSENPQSLQLFNVWNFGNRD
jgi:hypothetical protein